MNIYIILRDAEGYAGRELEEFVDVYSNETALLLELRKHHATEDKYTHCYKCDDIGVRIGEVDIIKSVKENKINLKVQ